MKKRLTKLEMMKKRKKANLMKRVIFLTLVLLVSIYSVLNANSYKSQVDPKVLTNYSATSTSDIIEFIPSDKSDIGIIVYPGGNVDFSSYSTLASEISKLGYYTGIVKMPFNLAILGGENRGKKIMKLHPEIKHWVVVGHSLGGAVGSNFAKSINASGMVFLAAYPLDDDFGSSNIPTLSIYGSEDLVISKERLVKSKDTMVNSHFIEIEGGNHAQFGTYGPQKGDGIASIREEEQLQETVKHIEEFLNTLD